MLQLVVVEPHGTQWRLSLEAEEYIVGREGTAGIVLPDPRVSRNHARIKRAGRKYVIEDLGSSNGVSIDGVRLSAPQTLQAGQTIEIAGFKLQVTQGATAAPAARGLPPEASVAQGAFVLVGPLTGDEKKRYPLRQGRITVGREPDNIVAVPDGSLSRHHAVLWVENGGVTIEDLQSSNGTYVGGDRIERRSVTPPCTISFGKMVFEIELGDTDHAAVPRRRWQPKAAAAAAVAVVLLVLGVVAGPRIFSHVRGKSAHAEPAAVLQLKKRHQAAQMVLARAQEQLQAQHWDAAIPLFNQLLLLDPINVEGRAGLLTAEQNADHGQRIAQANVALTQGRADIALKQVIGIAPPSFYAPAADAITQKARTALAQDAQMAASAACKKGDWRVCHGEAAVLLTYMPQSVAGLALVREAEDAMRTRHQAYATVSHIDNRTLHQQYPDSEVRQAMLRYASGDLFTAEKRLRSFSNHRGAKAARKRLQGFRSAKTRADGSAVMGDMTKALKGWQAALKSDIALSGAGPSVIGADLRHRLAMQRLRLGALAFDRGAYQQAFDQWHEGLLVEPHNADLTASMGKLESRAAGLFSAINAMAQPDDNACQKLKDILTMTLPSTDTYRDASAKLAQCNL